MTPLNLTMDTAYNKAVQPALGLTLNRGNGERRHEWRCPCGFCSAGVLLVQRCVEQHDLWRVTSDEDGSVWLVASTLPACPLCGSTLLDAA